MIQGQFHEVRGEHVALFQPTLVRYPHLTPEELKIAEDNLGRYLAVMMRIAERLKAEGKNLRDL